MSGKKFGGEDGRGDGEPYDFMNLSSDTIVNSSLSGPKKLKVEKADPMQDAELPHVQDDDYFVSSSIEINSEKCNEGSNNLEMEIRRYDNDSESEDSSNRSLDSLESIDLSLGDDDGEDGFVYGGSLYEKASNDAHLIADMVTGDVVTNDPVVSVIALAKSPNSEVDSEIMNVEAKNLFCIASSSSLKRYAGQGLPSVYESVHIRMARRLLQLFECPQTALKVSSAKRAFFGGHGRERENAFRASDLEAIGLAAELTTEQMEHLKNRLPPKDSKRFARSELFKEGLQNVLIKEVVELVSGPCTFQMDVHYIDIREIVASFLDSELLRNSGPFYENPFECRTLRQHGNRLRSLHKDYFEKFPDAGSDLLITLGVYTDASSKKKSTVYPIIVYFTQFDVYARVKNIETSMTLAGWMPRSRDIRVSKIENGSKVNIQIAAIPTDQRRDIENRMKIEAFACFLTHVTKVSNEGMYFRFNGSIRRIRVVVFSHVCDIPERCLMLGVEKNFRKVCTFCYGFKAKNPLSHLLRSDALDRQAHEEELEGEFGLKIRCPYNAAIYCYQDNYYNIFPFDMLHVFQGVVDRISLFYLEKHGEKKELITLSKVLGNDIIGCHAVAHHVIEESLFAFQFVALALIIKSESAKKEKEKEKYHKDAITACCLLYILFIMKDDAVGHLLSELSDTMDLLKVRIEDMVSTEKFIDTLKVHELLEHSIAHIIDFGSPKGFAASMGEMTHLSTWKTFDRATHRKNTSCYDMLLDSRVCLAMREADFLYRQKKMENPPPSSNVSWDTPWEPKARIRLLRRDGSRKEEVDVSISAMEQFDKNCKKIGKVLGLDRMSFENIYLVKTTSKSFTNFSQGVEMRICCEKRKVDIKSSVKLSVVQEKGAKLLSLLAFRNNEVNVVRGECENKGSCLCHSDIELFCSMAFDSSTSFGIPLLFVQINNEAFAIIAKLIPAIIPIEKDFENVFGKFRVAETCSIIPSTDFRGASQFRVHNGTIWVIKKRRFHEL